MYFMLLKKKHRNKITRVIVAFLLLSILNQVVAPTVAFALTSGPTAPEATSFEPIDTTDMVNPLTGDFTYNLPLLEVPGPEGGYPLSLSYHAGIQPNEDASWVGLGWTLNPGAITRSVNGFPDDWSGTNVSKRDYWEGGTRKTYNVGVSVGLPGEVANLSFGLAFSQDTYQGFGVGMNMGAGIGLGKSGLGVNVGMGVSPFGDSYVSAGIDYGGKLGSGISGSIGLGVSTNFESISANAGGGVGYSIPSSSRKGHNGSLLGASISSDGGSPSFAAGGISGSTENSKAGNISTSSSGFSFGIPIFPGVNLSLGYSKVRYWSDETSNTAIDGSVSGAPIALGPVPVLDDRAYDSYALLDPGKNIITNPDPAKVQGGAFPDFDLYTVSSQGLSGNIRPYSFQNQVFSQNRKDNNDTRLVQYFQTKTSSFITQQKAKFRFVNDFSNSYRQNYPDYADPNADLKTTAPPFDNNPQYGNNDGNFGFSPVDNNLAGSKSIEYYTKDAGGVISKSGFIIPTAIGLNRNSHRSGNKHVEGFKITNSSGVTYHYNLPAFSYEEEVYQEKKDGNSSNRQLRSEGYAYTWYLTSITGPDYVDKNNNQKLDEGDWGYWVNFEYGKWADDYVWRNPSEGFHRDEDSEFQSVSMGKKEVYYLNAIRTRSHIALFEKDVRLDGKGCSPEIFRKAAENKYSHPGGLFDENSAKSLRLDRIYLLKNTDASIVSESLSGGYSTLDRDDVNSVGRALLESKAIRVIDFNYNYDLCKGTVNSFLTFGNSQKYGKLTLASVVFRGIGGVNITPPIEFDYDFSAAEYKTATGNLSSDTFSTGSDAFELGDLVETDETSPVFCGVIIGKQQAGGNYIYKLKKSRFNAVNAVQKQLKTTKNPPYDKDAYDMWGMYKSDYESSANENLSRITTEISTKAVDAWCLRKIKTNLGSEIVVKYEGDNYSKSVLNNNLSLIITDFTKIDQTTWIFNVNTEGQDLAKLYNVGDKADFIILEESKLGSFEPTYSVISPKFVTGAGSEPYIEAVSNNTIRVKVKPNVGSIMDGMSGFQQRLLTGNLKVSGVSRLYGGGLRVKSIIVDDMLDNVSRTNYAYNKPDTQNSSGVTSYEPTIFDIDDAAQYGTTAKNVYRTELYRNIRDLYVISREIPSPGVMYEYVTIQNEIYRPDKLSSLPVEGKTTYQYEVFRENMVGRVEVSPSQTGSANGQNQYSKNVALRKFVAALGALKKVTKYDSNNKKLHETVNHYLHDGLEGLPLADFMNQYEMRLGQFNYQGLLKERYSEVKEVRQYNGAYNVLATFSAKEEYPAIPLGQTTKDYVTGIETGTENLEFDFYSGGLTKMVSKDAYGNRFLTEIVPAYRKYSAMGLKDMSTAYVSYSNMLTQEASKTIYKVNATNQPLGVVSASAQTWSNNIRVDDENGDATTYGQANIWRNKGTHQWMMPGTSTNNITPIGMFTPFDHAGGNSSSWKKTAEITRYNVYSAALEATDLNNHYAASKMGYNNSKVTVSASPARQAEIAYTGAEDGLLPNGKLSTGISLGAGEIDNSLAHTGAQSISLAPGATGITYTVPISNLDPVKRDYQIAVWVKSADVSSARLFYEVDNQGVQMITPGYQKTAAGWYLLETRVPASALASGTNLVVGCKNIGGQSTINFDDFRFQPFNAPTTSYVYHAHTGELTHVIDNNNLYVKYEYDAIGRLIKVSKEVLGKSTVPVVKEIAYNHAKPIKVVTEQASFYARVETSNYISNGGTEPEIWTGDIAIQFYTDPTCSTPYTLSSSTDFQVIENVFWQNLWGWGTYNVNHVYTVQGGNSGLYLGNIVVLQRGYWYDRDREDYIFINDGSTFKLVPYQINDPYRTLSTAHFQ